MKRYILIVVAIALGVLYAEAQPHKPEILRGANGTLLYSDTTGVWLTSKDWQDRYGRKVFSSTFGNKTRYDHSQEHGFIRYNILESVKLQGEGNIVWSRVIESDAPRDELMLAARKRMASILHQSDDKIVGAILEHGFIRDEKGRPWGIKHAHWKGVVTYEFRDGRYRVSVSNIQYKAERDASLGIYSLGFATKKAYAPFANLLYPYGSRASRYRYYRLVDFIDYNFTTTFVLFEADIEDTDW